MFHVCVCVWLWLSYGAHVKLEDPHISPGHATQWSGLVVGALAH